MTQRLALLAVALLTLTAPTARAADYKTLEEFALATFDTCEKVVSEGAAADAAFKTMGYAPGDNKETWLAEGPTWASIVTLHVGPLADGRTYTQCVTLIAPPPRDTIAFNAAFLSRVVANGVGVSGTVTQDGLRTITSYVDPKRGLLLNMATTADGGADNPATVSLTYSVVTQ